MRSRLRRPGPRRLGVRWRVLLAAAAALSGCAGQPAACPPLLDGVVWQTSHATARPEGDWHRLGARRLLVQWLEVDGTRFAGASPAASGADATPPDWARIGREPWAREVWLGLAGAHDEARARADVGQLAARSAALAQGAARGLPLPVTAWYFPVEVDPTWQPQADLRRALAPLPRPLWLSAYDSANLGPDALADWVERWLPADVGILWQDGVGVHARTPAVAADYARRLAARLGPARLQLIAEAFRPAPGGGFRSASAAELLPQLRAYAGWPLWVFDGPHYLGRAQVAALQALDTAERPGCRRPD